MAARDSEATLELLDCQRSGCMREGCHGAPGPAESGQLSDYHGFSIQPETPMTQTSNDVLKFWFETLQPAQWWQVDPALDREIGDELADPDRIRHYRSRD
jgi:hypothetical protein